MPPAPRRRVPRAGELPRRKGSFVGRVALVRRTLVGAARLTLGVGIGWRGRRRLGRCAVFAGARLDTVTEMRCSRPAAGTAAAPREDQREARAVLGPVGPADS